MDVLKGLKVLIVDDSKICSYVIARFLADSGAQLSFAANGKEAVEKCRNECYSIILMNIKMPVMDGFEATAGIRKFDSDAVIIAHTNYSSIREKCLESGFNDFIRKPVRRDELRQVIERNLK